MSRTAATPSPSASRTSSRRRCGRARSARARSRRRTSRAPTATDHGLHAWLTLDDERALAEADAADARLAAARARGPGGASTALHPLLGIPVALKDLVSVARRPVHGGLADPRGLPLAVRRPHHRAPARRRRGDPRQDEHGRVRDGLVDRALARSGRPPTRGTSSACPGGSSRRLGGGRRRVPRAARRSARTPAARSASRPPCAGSSG